MEMVHCPNGCQRAVAANAVIDCGIDVAADLGPKPDLDHRYQNQNHEKTRARSFGVPPSTNCRIEQQLHDHQREDQVNRYDPGSQVVCHDASAQPSLKS